MYLCIDTISTSAGITILDDQFATHYILDPQNSSEGIIETIDKALSKTKAGLVGLKGVLVIKGPGSFTGLRVGISVANQFAHQLKIPILSLRIDEWWQYRTPKNTVYIQTMNRSEVYISDENGRRIIPIEDLSKMGPQNWTGQLKFDHATKIPSNFTIVEVDSTEGTWQKVAKAYANELESHRIYDLVEPFYGKEPNITKSKKTTI